MRRWLALGLAVIAGGGVALALTAPAPIAPDDWALRGDPVRGARAFALAGCASCHAAAADDPLVLAGGQAFATDFGTFYAPNISSDPVQGVGAWSDADLASAILRGVTPAGAHYYPAFPYTSYARADRQDVADLIAYLRGLPPASTPSLDHDLRFPFTIRAGLGLWKARYLRPDWVIAVTEPEALRGRALVEGLGHCAECHTPRDAFGGLDHARWMQGAPNPSGEGRIPALTPDSLTWSVDEIARYLETGFTPDFDSAGGSMAAVVRNTAQLTAQDRQAIASYLKALP